MLGYVRADLRDRGCDPFGPPWAIDGDVVRAVKNRATIRFESRGETYFLKRHDRVGILEVLKNLAVGKWPVVGARNEYLACQHLRDRGLVVPRVAQYGMTGRSPLGYRSFVICDELTGYRSLEDLLDDGGAQRLDTSLRRRLAEALGRLVGDLHRAGVNHRDLYVCHCFYSIEALQRGQFDLALIDLHRAQIRPSTPARWRLRDLGALLFSCIGYLPTRAELAVFRCAYRRSCGRRDGAEFWSKVRRRAAVLTAREARRRSSHRRFDYDVDLPVNLEIADGERLRYDDLLRLVPGRRAVFRAGWSRGATEQPVIVKAFMGFGAHRRARREERGLACLALADVAAPKVLGRRRVDGAELVLLNDLGELRELDEPRLDCVSPLFERLAASGIRHNDLHRGNVVQRGEAMVLLDGGAVRGGSLDVADALARWSSEFAVGTERAADVPAAVTGGWSSALTRHRSKRAAIVMKKVLRETTTIRAGRTWGERWLAVRDNAVAPADLEAAFEAGGFLKTGRTSTVVRHGAAVVKRLNRKSWWHGLRTSLRSSRAARAWMNMHAMRALGLAGPRPVALLERSVFGYRTASYLSYEFVPGVTLADRVASQDWDETLIDAVVELFEHRGACWFSHGDCKADNFVVTRGAEIVPVDLDGGRFHTRRAAFQKHFRRDIERFLANWGTAAPRPLVERLTALVESV